MRILTAIEQGDVQATDQQKCPRGGGARPSLATPRQQAHESNSDGFGGDRDAAAYLVLAMAETELKQTTAARNSFEKGCAIVERKLPRLDSKDLGNYWQDGLIANLLLREARTLIKETSEPVTDPAKSARP
jgi:hypothetical protein